MLLRLTNTGRDTCKRGRDLLDQLSGQFADEAGRLAVGINPIEPALFGIGDVELAHGAGHADVAQAALLLETGQIGDRALMRKQAVFHAGQKHHREFQPLGRMQGHHLHTVIVRVGLPLAGLQHRMREKGFERRQFGFGLRLRRETLAPR